MAETKKTEVQEQVNKAVVIRGILVKATNGATRYSDVVKNHISIKVDPNVIPWVIFDKAYENSGAKMTPKWVKDRGEYINLSSKFDIPTRTVKNRDTSLEDLMAESSTLIGSEVGVSLVVKEGAVYPKAIKIFEDGEEVNPFADFE